MSLRQRLAELQVKTEGDPGFVFIPDIDLSGVISDETIKAALPRGNHKKTFHKLKDVVPTIAQGGRKTFAILVYIGNVEAIYRFIENDHFQQLDSKLPLDMETAESVLEDKQAGKEFYEVQWMFLAPVLHKDRSHRILPVRSQLPILKKEVLQSASKGCFGEIYRVKLHPFHQQLVELNVNGEALVALKEIKLSGSECKADEERILSSLRTLRHRNVISLLTSYTLGKFDYFVFPLAQGDLDKLLSGKMNPPPILRHPQAVLRELHGLSSALEMLHRFFVNEYNLEMMGCHRDLKPANILIKDGKFLLADFGLSRLDAADKWEDDRFSHAQGDYRAPESASIRARGSKKAVGTPSDVWSFGCILAEVVTFLLRGAEGVETFVQKRTHTIQRVHITHTFHVDGDLNSDVEEWLSELYQDEEDIIPHRDVIHLVKEILKLVPEERPSIQQVVDALFLLSQKAMTISSCRKAKDLVALVFLPQEAMKAYSCRNAKSLVALELENRRFMEWKQASGVDEKFTALSQIEDITILKIHRGAQVKVLDLLTEIEDEIHLQVSWCKHGLPVTSAQFKSLIDILESFIPEPNKAESKPDTEYQGSLAEFVDIAESKESSYSDSNKMILKSSDILNEAKFREGVHFLANLRNSKEGLRDCPVLIERMLYPKGLDKEFLLRAEKISKLFSTPVDPERTGRRVLTCRGYYHKDNQPEDEQHWYGLVYEMPTPQPETLHSIIKKTKKRYLRPNLGDIFDIATKIIRCVLEVQRVGLMHKGVSSHNVIFFPDASGGPSSRWLPYLIGFNDSRESSWRAFTEGLNRKHAVDLLRYHHPEYIKKRQKYRPEFDYYSVGVVLLEIGRWHTLGQILHEKQLTLQSGDAIREILLEECQNNLGNSMGTLYRDATAACLKSDFVLNRGGNGLREDYKEKVLNRIMKCRA